MGKDTTTDRDRIDEKDSGHRVMAADKKVAAKKVRKKKSKKKAASKKSKSTKTAAASKPASVGAVPQPLVAPPPRQEPAFAPPSDEARGSGTMRGIVALWGPLAIIVLLIVVSRLGDEEPGEMADRPVAGLSSSIAGAESMARDVVEDVQDALTGGDPQAAAVLGTGSGSQGSVSSDLAAAFQDAGVASTPPGAVSELPKAAATAEEPWGPSSQTTAPASVSGVPGGLPPHPENPWAPVDPRTVMAMPADPYANAGGIPAPVVPGAGPAYGHYGGGYAPPGAYAPPPQSYPPLPPGYGSAPAPAYGGAPPAYSQPQAYGGAPAYGAAPAYSYPPQPQPQPYGQAPAPYPPGYYPPGQ